MHCAGKFQPQAEVACRADFSLSIHATQAHPRTRPRRRSHFRFDELGALDLGIAQTFAAAAIKLLQRERIAAGAIRALGSHGQTVRHRPTGSTPYTLQLGDPNVIAELTGITTVADFRRRDVAAGGQRRAPLAPAFHAALLARTKSTRVVLNLGGIANITILSSNSKTALRGFDTGPASCLLDAWTEQHPGPTLRRRWCVRRFRSSRRHRCSRASNPDPYFAATHRPKSTGREDFIWRGSKSHLRGLVLAPKNVQATLVALSAQTIAAAIRTYARDAREVYVCGGGGTQPRTDGGNRTRTGAGCSLEYRHSRRRSGFLSRR